MTADLIKLLFPLLNVLDFKPRRLVFVNESSTLSHIDLKFLTLNLISIAIFLCECRIKPLNQQGIECVFVEIRQIQYLMPDRILFFIT